jgi:hypothetical protein
MFRPLDFSLLKASPATVATISTERAPDERNVAKVASVASPDNVVEKWAWPAVSSGTGRTGEAAPRAFSDREPGLPATIDRLRSLPCPKDYSPERWERNRDGALRFASESAAEAVHLGWSLDELFAIAEPFANVSLQGAAWFVGESTVIDVTAAAITLRRSSGSTTRIYRRSLQ